MRKALLQEEAARSCRKIGRLLWLLSSARLALPLQNRYPCHILWPSQEIAQKSGTLLIIGHDP